MSSTRPTRSTDDRTGGSIEAPAYSCQGNSFALVGEEAAADCHDPPIFSGGREPDGLLGIGRSDRADATIRLFEKDGSESDLCGNGILCVAYHICNARRVQECSIEMGGKFHRASVQRNRVTAGFQTLQDPALYTGIDGAWVRGPGQVLRLTYRAETLYFVNSGEPHLLLLAPDPTRLDMHAYQKLVADRRLFPRGTNFDVVSTRSPFRIRTYERGVNAFTGSCGTGSIAAAQLLRLLGCSEQSEMSFHSSGGVHKVALDDERVFLTGRVKREGSVRLRRTTSADAGSDCHTDGPPSARAPMAEPSTHFRK